MKTIALVIASLMISSAVFASDTARGNYSTGNAAADEYLNYGDVTHTHNYEQTSSYKAPLGYGVDLTLYEMDVKGVGLGFGIDGEYDQNNGVWGAMAKVKVNTTGLINQLLGK